MCERLFESAETCAHVPAMVKMFGKWSVDGSVRDFLTSLLRILVVSGCARGKKGLA